MAILWKLLYFQCYCVFLKSKRNKINIHATKNGTLLVLILLITSGPNLYLSITFKVFSIPTNYGVQYLLYIYIYIYGWNFAE